jgi:hypothetical protein
MRFHPEFALVGRIRSCYPKEHDLASLRRVLKVGNKQDDFQFQMRLPFPMTLALQSSLVPSGSGAPLRSLALFLSGKRCPILSRDLPHRAAECSGLIWALHSSIKP